MAKLQLFGGRLSPFVEKVARALELKGLEFELVDIKGPGDLKRWNPVTGKMPVLEIDGEKVYDSTFILRRIEALQPEPPLFSADPAVAASQRLLEDWADESLYWYLMGLRWSEPNEARTLDQLAGIVPPLIRPVARLMFRRNIKPMTRAQGLGRLPYDVLIQETGSLLDDLVSTLAGRAFFFSDRVSAADLALYGEFSMGCSEATPDFAALLHDRPALVDHMKRVEDATRP